MTPFAFFAMTASLFITVYEYPTFADSGKSLVFFLLLCGVLWFLPVSLCSAEMATIKGYQEGGIYSWVGKQTGEKFGFAAIFFQWFQITVGFVTMIYFIIGTLAYIFQVPELDKNPVIKFFAVIIIFWVLTFLQFKGTAITSKIAKYGFSIGIIVPVLAMLALAINYFMKGNAVSTNFTGQPFVPQGKNIAALTSFVLAYMGVEASAPHISELQNPKKNYPKILITLVIIGIVLSTIGGSVVSMVLNGSISSNEGVMDTIQQLVSPGKITFPVILLGLLIVFGISAQVSSWIVSPTEGLQFAASKGLLPARFEKKNKNGVPVPLLIVQGIIVTIWAALLTFGSGGSGGNIAFQTAINLTVIIYLSAYILLFISYMIVVVKKKNLERDFQIPGGTVVKLIVAGFGLLLSIAATVTAFIVPDSIPKASSGTYLIMLVAAYIVTLAIPFLVYQFYSKKNKAKLAAQQGSDESENG